MAGIQIEFDQMVLVNIVIIYQLKTVDSPWAKYYILFRNERHHAIYGHAKSKPSSMCTNILTLGPQVVHSPFDE